MYNICTLSHPIQRLILITKTGHPIFIESKVIHLLLDCPNLLTIAGTLIKP